jgi:hypothetical protein
MGTQTRILFPAHFRAATGGRYRLSAVGLVLLLALGLLWSLAALSSGAAAQQAGTLRLNSGVPQAWNGSAWQTSRSTTSVGTCSNAGEISVSGADLTFCDGATRWSMRGTVLGTCTTPSAIRVQSGTELAFCSSNGTLYSMVNFGCTPSSTQACAIANGTGSQTCLAGATWGTCGVASCNTGYHAASGACVSNTQACPITNGTGTQTWNTATSTWGSCTVSSCNSGYYQSGSSCLAKTYAWSTSTFGSCTGGTGSWSSSSWSTCSGGSGSWSYGTYGTCSASTACTGTGLKPGPRHAALQLAPALRRGPTPAVGTRTPDPRAELSLASITLVQLLPTPSARPR